MINWPKRQGLHTTTTTSTAASTAASTATSSTITTIRSITKTTALALGYWITIWGNAERKVELNQNILCIYRLLIRAYQQYFWKGLSYQEETSRVSWVGYSVDQKAKYTCYYCYEYCCFYFYYQWYTIIATTVPTTTATAIILVQLRHQPYSCQFLLVLN